MPKAESIINSALQQGKIVSAICLAPMILAIAGVLKGKNATCAPVAVADLKSYGVNFVDKGVVQDGQIITANGPLSATDFGKTIDSKLFLRFLRGPSS